MQSHPASLRSLRKGIQMEDVPSTLELIVSWLPLILMLSVFGYFTMKLVKVQRRSAAALERIGSKLEAIETRLKERDEPRTS